MRLSHEASAVELPDAARGLPLIISHDTRELPIGRVRNLRLEKGELIGEPTFGARGADVEADMRAGIITDVSVGAEYQLSNTRELDDGTIVINRWRPFEVSAVTQGAIEGAGIRNAKVIEMDPEKEKLRKKALAALFAEAPGHEALLNTALLEDWTVEQASAELVKRVLAAQAPSSRGNTPQSTASAHVAAGEDARDKYVAAATASVRLRSGLYLRNAQGVLTDEAQKQRKADIEAVRGTDYYHASLEHLAIESLRAQGIYQAGVRREELINLAIMGNQRTARYVLMADGMTHMPSDFTNVITTNVNAALGIGYTQAEETYRAWTSVRSMNDFRAHDYPVLSTFPDLKLNVNGAGEYEYGTLGDKKESMTLETYGILLGLNRRTIINDTLGAFTEVPMRMGQKAANKEGDVVYAVLTANGLMNETGRALFNTTDGNLASSGAVIAVASISAARKAMRLFKSPESESGEADGAVLGIRPRFLLVPAALETTAQVFIASERDPTTVSSSGDISSIGGVLVNPFAGQLVPISEHRLDANSATAWYLLAAPGQQVDTVARGYLNGAEAPYTEFQEGFTRDGIVFKVRHDFAAGALDWRGMYKQPGA